MNAFAEQSRELRAEIDQALDHSIADGGWPDSLYAAVRHSLMGQGKRLRPLLVLMSAEACGCGAWAAMPAACAVEMVHTYSLIHDDLPSMDDDDMRRGRPSCHAKFGEAMAILAGDALQSLAYEVLARGVQPQHVAAECCAVLARAAGPVGMVGGQVDDILSENQTGDLERLESIHRRKTGALFNVSLQLGALVAGTTDEQFEALSTYGSRLGLAFQIVDDLLDLRGSESQMGKRTGKDSAQGKLTFPSLLGLEESERRAGQLVQEARAALAVFGDRGASLEALANYVFQRSQ